MTTLNEKGAVAHISTLSPLVDLFGVNSPNFRTLEMEEFQNIVSICYNAYLSNPRQYISLLKYRRSTDFLGHKMMYYIMASIIRENHRKEYPAILEWSHEYKKDLLRMARIYNESYMQWDDSDYTLDMTDIIPKNKQTFSFMQRNVPTYFSDSYDVPPELELYSKTILENLDKSDLCFKYIGTHHFNVENTIIKRTVNQMLEKKGKQPYTNSQFRKLFSQQKEKLFLFDRFLQGMKDDGTPLQTGDEEYVVSYMKKMSSTAFQNAKNTISKFYNPLEEKEYKKVLYRAFLLLHDQVANKEFSVKTHGLNNCLAKSCYNAYKTKTFDPFLESEMTSKLEKIKENMSANFPLGLDVVVDCSGSMCGEPLNNALYITLLLHRLYNIGSAVLFSDTAERVYIEGETWYDSIQSLYCYPQGSTNLESVFSCLENNDNTTLVITDGDCDPMGQENNSPFQEALRLFPIRKFIVWNVKQSKLHFPYSVEDSRVGYISGNEPSVIDAVFKCLSNGELTPMTLLESCISEIEHPFVLDPIEKPFTVNQIENLFFAIKKNIPKIL